MKTLIVMLGVACVATLGVPALADWDPNDGHKMHFPQLPDEDGWDVKACDDLCLADDWQCSQTGPVEDIHFWGSWKNGIVGVLAGI